MDILTPILVFLESSKYILIFLGSFTEGAFVMMTGGVLWHAGQTEFWPTYAALFAGDILSDIMWYFVGFFGARRLINRWGKTIRLTPAIVEKIERRFHRYRLSILIISKVTNGYGTGAGTILMAGMLRVPFVAFLLISIFGGGVWVFMIMFIGYYFGNVLELVPPGFKIVTVIAGIVVAFLLIRYINRRFAKAA